MRKSLLLIMILLSNISFAYTNNQEVISINSTDVNNSPKVKIINAIKMRIKEKYQLDIKINAEQIYAEKNELEALELGLTNMVVLKSTTMIDKYNIRDFDIFEIPFIFNGLNEFNTFNNSVVSEELLRKINKKNKNIYGLTFLAKNYKQIESSTDMSTYQNIKNKSLLLPETEINNVLSNVLNPNNKEIIVGELNKEHFNKNNNYTNMLSIDDFDKYEMFKYNRNILLTYHGLDIDIVLVNKRWFNKLSTETQVGIIEIIKNAGLEGQKLMLVENQNVINKLKSQNITIKQISPEDRDLFRKEMAPVHRYYFNYINKDLLIKIYNLFK